MKALSRRPIIEFRTRSEEHTSELQSLRHLVCRLLLEKKKKDKVQDLHIKSHLDYETHLSHYQHLINGAVVKTTTARSYVWHLVDINQSTPISAPIHET